ncbi:MAG: hypothetical protein AUJ72_05060 [Candidatus Omnitrophica bacterium CG1_02_46_14]|nr:MAG: hypothetical protein AUJ72_05060 [Candidatus Omnitrophica bacterium CG1_02_46_14]
MIPKLLALYQKLSKREKVILSVVCVILGLLAVDRLIVDPVFQKLGVLDRQIKDEEAAVKKSLNVLLRKQQISAESKELVIFSTDPEKPEQEMTSLLKEIENIAGRSSVSLLYVKPGNTSQEGGVRKNFATLECEAQMAEIAEFFHNIENSTRLLQIEKYTIQPKNKESSIAKCAVTISRTVLS